MANLGFLKNFKKQVDKMDSVTTDFSPPKHWYSSGNLALNKIMSGSFKYAIPQSRIVCFAGPSGSGKSFLAANVLRQAQEDGAFALVLDSENAMDETFLGNIGVNTEPEKLMYCGVVTISNVVSILSDFLGGYQKEYGKDNIDAPKIVILLDSLDMLMTDTEESHFEKGEQRGDLGQLSKMKKQLLRTVVNRISRLNVTFIFTHQVYENQDMVRNPVGKYIVNNSVQYSASQIYMITKLKLREGSEVAGIRMRVEVNKSRFTKLGSKIEIEVPYASGMNKFSGLLEMLLEEGIITQAGAWYSFERPDGEVKKFQRKNLTQELVDEFLLHPKLMSDEEAALALIETEEITNTDVEEE